MTFMCRGIRGATTARANTKEAILEATREMLEQLVKANGLQNDSIAAAIFSTTRDLNAEFPAVAARLMGWTGVALLDTHEMDVPDALPSCIRALILVNTDKQAHELVNVYLRGAVNLRARRMEER
ncbi:MAG: chorismate mutase [Dehalococcoidia bacterium]|nr:chorismate mutase [Dehalococcoidia bacterium]